MKHTFTFILSSKHASENAHLRKKNSNLREKNPKTKKHNSEREIKSENNFSLKGWYLFLDKAGVPQGEGREVSFVRQGGICSARLQTKQTGVGQRG